MGLEAGQRVLDRYVIQGKLGEGGMGAVYRAVHDRLDLAVVIKVLTQVGDQGLAYRFDREAKLMAQVRHPNVVAIHDYGFLDDGSPCMAMELIEGVPLDERLRANRALPWQDAVRFTLDLLAGLEAIHASAVLHRDLKPANLVIARSTVEFLKIIDFGIAKPTKPDATQLTQAGGIVGTPAYMSPEQLYGYELDERSDLYSVGLILYEMLSGAEPASGDSATSVAKRISQALPAPRAPAHLPAVPGGVQELALALLHVDKARRPRTARDAYARLDAARAAAMAGPAMPAVPAAGADVTLVPGGGPPAGGAGATVVRPRPGGAPPPPATGFIEAAAEGEGEVGEGTHRYLVGARIPRSRLVQRAEQRWLASLAHPGGRSFALGGQFWFAWQLTPVDPVVAENEATTLATSVEDRYGSTARVAWTLVGRDFAITPAAMSGAAPFPDAVQRLMDDLAA